MQDQMFLQKQATLFDNLIPVKLVNLIVTLAQEGV